MKLYYHPVSNTSRPIMMFAADAGIGLEYQVVDLFKGEHLQPAHAALDENIIGRNAYLCGSEITLAEVYPGISRWLKTMKSRPNWEKVNRPFYDLAASVKDMSFEAV